MLWFLSIMLLECRKYYLMLSKEFGYIQTVAQGGKCHTAATLIEAQV